MSRGILLAGNESSLFSALGGEAAKRTKHYVAAFIRQEQPPQIVEYAAAPASGTDETASGRIVLDWNPSSPISAKTLTLSALNHLERLDDAILVCVPPAYRKNAEAFSAQEIDQFIDYHIKGWFFLVRELAALFTARKQGTLSLVLPEVSAGSAEVDFTGPIAAAAFRSFAQGILLSSLNTPYNALGFSTAEPGGDQAFAAYVFKTIEEGKRNFGKWHKYGKFALFGR